LQPIATFGGCDLLGIIAIKLRNTAVATARLCVVIPASAAGGKGALVS
jgi:hypothetical protein